MKNKKSIMFFASILIVVFHLWINISKQFFEIENFIRQICYIGVDIFFFLSAYSIYQSKMENYKKFLKSRFIKIYLVFIIFLIIAFFYNKLTLAELLLTMSGISFFIKGGGSFLWFIPAIMIMYIFLPIYKKFEKNYTKYCLLFLWILSVIVLSVFIKYDQLFIFLNRFPIIMLGYYFSKHDIFDKLTKKSYFLITMVLVLFGIIILYFTNNLKISFIHESYYIFAIPLTVGLIFLINLIDENIIIKQLGSITLEMYAIQMIFGFKLSNKIYVVTMNPLFTNILVILMIIILSLITNFILKKLTKENEND